MKLFRNNEVCVSEKVMFYAHIISKAKCNGTAGDMTVDNLVECELIDKWEREYPPLLDAWEKNNEVRQSNKKRYAQVESEAIASISPVPGSQQLPTVSKEI